MTYVPDAALTRTDDPDPDDPPSSPDEVLARWLPGPEDDRPLLSLATVDPTGAPDVRTVLLSGWDATGLRFHTDAGSRKAAHLDRDRRAAASLVWPEVLRQLTVQGEVRRATAEEDARAFAARPRYLRLLAWLNTPSYAGLPQAERTARWAAFDREHPDDGLAAPPSWVGFVLVPNRITFWQGHAERSSVRVEYTRAGSGWTLSRLPG